MANTNYHQNRQAVQLSDQERTELDHMLEHYPVASGASIDALKMIQKYHGWVSDEYLHALALYMQLPVAELESVATFYNLIFRKPVGENLVHPCDGVSCAIMGYRKVHQQLKKTLEINDGETTENNAFTLIPLPCLGACDKAPVVLINQTLHENVNPDQVAEIINNVTDEAHPE
ncbi:MAG: NADH-quinone oxidoreductase subunit NuoE [Gammaproteobacteria bacterium]|nr:NADH-quinone oxidoreductase subunit NuoE [Gammaproteobacteria bacterium]